MNKLKLFWKNFLIYGLGGVKVPNSPGSGQDEKGEGVIVRWGLKEFLRPVNDQEIDRYVGSGKLLC